MVAVPAATPVTTPLPAPTEAIDGSLLLHVPPPEPVSVVVKPVHTVVVPPVIEGLELTVTCAVEAQPVAGNV